MSIKSNSYTNAGKYFRDAFEFLNDYKWIYKSSNTEFLESGILEEMPDEWINCLSQLPNEEFNDIPLNGFNECWPSDFKTFLIRLRKLKPTIETALPLTKNAEPTLLPTIKGINPKKQHEIIQLSQQIYDICGTEIDTLVDFGSGLGYLSQTLYHQFNYNLLGLESDMQRVQTAQNRQQKLYPNSVNSVKFVQHFIGISSIEFMNLELKKHFPQSKRFAIIGLHACADLSITAINLFLAMENIGKLIIMPCCYHKMCKKMDGDGRQFENIPLSQLLSDILKGDDCMLALINVPFLRLASQQTAVRWKNQTEAEHKIHGENMFYRAALDSSLDKDESIMRNNKRSQVESNRNQFSSTVFDLLIQKYEIHCVTSGIRKSWSLSHEKRFNLILERYPNGGFLAEILTGLQAAIQSLCENVVLLDRICYIEEEFLKHTNGHKVEMKKIMLESLSPRCIVIIAEKN